MNSEFCFFLFFGFSVVVFFLSVVFLLLLFLVSVSWLVLFVMSGVCLVKDNYHGPVL